MGPDRDKTELQQHQLHPSFVFLGSVLVLFSIVIRDSFHHDWHDWQSADRIEFIVIVMPGHASPVRPNAEGDGFFQRTAVGKGREENIEILCG